MPHGETEDLRPAMFSARDRDLDGARRPRGARAAARESLRVPLEYSGARQIRQVLVHLAASWSVGEEPLDDFSLALTEAFSNAVRHGTGGPGDVAQVDLTVGPQHFQATLDYPGRPFPLRLPQLPEGLATGGRGRYLMRALCDDVDYEFCDGRTRVRLTKRWRSR